VTKFPKRLYVQRVRVDGENEHFFAGEEDVNKHAELGKTIEVGLYEFIKPLKLMTITKEITDG
jgi:hypothetical protein